VRRRDRQRANDIAEGKEKPCPGGDRVRIPKPFMNEEFRSFVAVLISAAHQGLIRRRMDDWLDLRRASTLIPAMMGDRRIKDVSFLLCSVSFGVCFIDLFIMGSKNY
jgi:hypothetical protein